jgi:hypothetical protein
VSPTVQRTDLATDPNPAIVVAGRQSPLRALKDSSGGFESDYASWKATMEGNRDGGKGPSAAFSWVSPGDVTTWLPFTAALERDLLVAVVATFRRDGRNFQKSITRRVRGPIPI